MSRCASSLFVLSSLFALGACAGEVQTHEAAVAADRVFVNGVVHAIDARRTRAEAVAIAAGEIVYVGDDAGARDLIGPQTLVTDLAGRMLLPGFHDSHLHLITGGLYLTQCNLLELESAEAVIARIEECARELAWGEERWLLGGGWPNHLFPNANPSKRILDEIVQERPAYLVATDGHSAWVNSKALELAGIDANTPDPPNGHIERLAGTGEPSGTLRNEAMLLVKSHTPPPTLEQRIDGLEAAMHRAHASGITALIEPGLDEFLLEAYAELSRRGGLRLRVLASLSPIGWQPGAAEPEAFFELLARREQYRSAELEVDSVKLYTDGVLESGTAYLLEPYDGIYSARVGHSYYRPSVFEELVTALDARGLQVHVHSIGDAGVRMALDAFEVARRRNGATGNRHHVVHLQLVHPDDWPRFAELGVAANFQPLWAYPDPWITELGLPVAGPARVDRMYPIGGMHAAGAFLVGGSDWWVTSMDPLQAIEVAVRRQDPDLADGPILNAANRVDLDTIVAAYTINGAWLSGREALTGSIELGKRADLIVLDRDLFAIPATEINEARVQMTLFDGREVFRLR